MDELSCYSVIILPIWHEPKPSRSKSGQLLSLPLRRLGSPEFFAVSIPHHFYVVFSVRSTLRGFPLLNRKTRVIPRNNSARSTGACRMKFSADDKFRHKNSIERLLKTLPVYFSDLLYLLQTFHKPNSSEKLCSLQRLGVGEPPSCAVEPR